MYICPCALEAQAHPVVCFGKIFNSHGRWPKEVETKRFVYAQSHAAQHHAAGPSIKSEQAGESIHGEIRRLQPSHDEQLVERQVDIVRSGG